MTSRSRARAATPRPPAREEDGRSSGGPAALSEGYLRLIEEYSQDGNDDVYGSRVGKEILHDAYSNWLATSRNWKSFWTLTLREPREVDVVDRYFRRLIQVLNSRTFGKRYSRFVGHSYFSYVKGTEYQIRDVVHFHVICDQPVNYELIHSFWNRSMGFVWIENIQDVSAAANYVSKITRYVRKKGDVDQYFRAEEKKPPRIKPSWWND